MATKADFTEDEWKTLEKGLAGAGLLVSASDRDFTDTFSEASHLAKYLDAARQGGETELMREVAHVKGIGLGLSGRGAATGTLEALRTSVALLGDKAPDEVEPYRRLVLGAAKVVAEAKSGVSDTETAAIDAITEAVGAA